MKKLKRSLRKFKVWCVTTYYRLQGNTPGYFKRFRTWCLLMGAVSASATQKAQLFISGYTSLGWDLPDWAAPIPGYLTTASACFALAASLVVEDYSEVAKKVDATVPPPNDL